MRARMSEYNNKIINHLDVKRSERETNEDFCREWKREKDRENAEECVLEYTCVLVHAYGVVCDESLVIARWRCEEIKYNNNRRRKEENIEMPESQTEQTNRERCRTTAKVRAGERVETK